MPETQVVRIQCPNCGTQYETPIRTVIDVGQNPELRQALLSGQLNVAICPKCNQGGIIESPLVVHDAEAEFLAVYFPPQVQIPELERQRMIGEMTQEMMRNLPPEQRKGYFLNPRQFASRQSLLDAVLGTMGVSQEELDRQRKKLKTMEQMLVMADDRKGLEMMLKGQDSQFDYEFFALLSDRLAQVEAAGDDKTAERMRMLYDNLLELTTYGKRVAKQQAAIESLREISTPEQLVDRIVAADPDEAGAIAVAARPLLDYAFFQTLTERMETAQREGRADEARRLSELREALLALTERLDQEAQAALEQATALLRELLGSEDPERFIRDRLNEFDDAFFIVLGANLKAAEEAKREDVRQRLQQLGGMVLEIAQEKLPPEVRLIRQLLAASDEAEVTTLLQQNESLVTENLLLLMRDLSNEVEDEGTALRLRQLAEQVEAWLRARE